MKTRLDDKVSSATNDAGGAVAVTERIRAAILAGEFSPNERLIEGDLIERFESTRANVRSALIELTGEGLVEREANRSARVHALTANELIEILEVRSLVEGLCAAKAAERITDQESDELRSIIASMETNVDVGNLFPYLDLNTLLHRRISEIAQHPAAFAVVRRLRAQSSRVRRELELMPESPSLSLPEHRRIVEAVVAHDAQAAEIAMRSHVVTVIDLLRSLEPNAIR